ncbi:MAG: tryptophan synthase subunit alpha [Bacteroidia bacterium]|nr:tryptophan synthase subunit alpha [Bacteroidia bacterium]
MNRINRLFRQKEKNILSIYFTAGYPGLDDTMEIITCLDKAGVDMIEIGMPFSDPVADGPVIQGSSEKALKNGMSLSVLFSQLKEVRGKTDLPLLLMGYFNPIYRYGVEKFLETCNKTGIDGTIIPDLPVEEYTDQYEKLFMANGIINTFLITPQSSEARIRYLDSISKGFLYVVSTSATTGGKKSFETSHLEYFSRLNEMGLRSPGLTGFGISDKATFEQACRYSNGAIIGSAFVRALEEKGSLPENILRFIKTFR